MGIVNSALIEFDAPAVAALIDAGEAVLVDVREIHEWCRERVAGSVWQPMSDFDAAVWPEFPGRTVVIACQKGVRSAMVANRLIAAGHPWAIHLKGGLDSWKEAGLGLEEGE